MEKFTEEVIRQVNPFKCNFITNIDNIYQDKLINLFREKIKKYSDESKRLVLVPLDGLELQTKSVNIEKAINNFENKYKTNTDEKNCIDLRNIIIEQHLTKKALGELKQTIFRIERDKKETEFSSLKMMLMSELLLHMMLMETIKCNKKVLDNKYLKYSLDGIKQYYSYLNACDIKKLLYEARTDLFNLDFLYQYLDDSPYFYVYVMKSSEYISDFALQEVVNDPMFNQRSGIISFNYISADSITHHKCGRFILEEGHDINSINGDMFVKKAK
jgi:hypothetical protein